MIIRGVALIAAYTDRFRQRGLMASLSTALLVWLGTVTLIPLEAAAQEVENVRGLIQPKNQTTISSEISARIIEIPFRAGDAFAREDVLVRFDCGMYRAQLDGAAADRDARATEFSNAQELLSYNATSPVQVEILGSEAKRAAARFEMERLRVEACTIRAPYRGSVITLLANEHESVGAGAKLLSILSNDALEIDLIVPSDWLSWLRTGDRFRFSVDETNQVYEAQVARIGAMVDPVSQTVQVIGVFEQADGSVRAGMSGNASFDDSQ